MSVTLSFPGIGISDFSVNPIAFSIGNISVRWYGIIITLGIILAFTYCSFRAKQEKIVFDDLLDIGIFTIIFAVIGARAYYVATTWDEYDSFMEVIAIWNGGLAIYGGIIAGAITVFCVCKYKKLNCLKVMDSVAPAVMIGQILGRWGNFFNGEAYGGVVSERSPLYFLRMGIYPHEISGVKGMAYVHPTFLYESVWNLIGFLIINALYKKKKFDGQILLMYVTWYGFGRMFIEGLRTDSLYVGPFRISQVIAFVCFVTGSILLIINFLKIRRQTLEGGEYQPTYAKISGYKCDEKKNEPVAENIEDKENDTQDTDDESKTQEDDTQSLSKDEITDKVNDILDNKGDD